MRFTLWVTRAGFWLLIVAVIVGIVVSLLVTFTDPPREWSWLKWRRRGERLYVRTTWTFFSLLTGAISGWVFFVLGRLVLPRLGIKVMARDPNRRLSKRRGKWVEESWEVDVRRRDDSDSVK